MPDLLISKPDETEHAPYYGRYIDMVPDGDILGTLAGQIGVTLTELRKISDEDSLHRYAPGKWSVREVVGHMIDAERIFAYRALRFARNDRTAAGIVRGERLRSGGEVRSAAVGGTDRRVLCGAAEQHRDVSRLDAKRRGCATGIASDNEMSVRARGVRDCGARAASLGHHSRKVHGGEESGIGPAELISRGPGQNWPAFLETR